MWEPKSGSTESCIINPKRESSLNGSPRFSLHVTGRQATALPLRNEPKGEYTLVATAAMWHNGQTTENDWKEQQPQQPQSTNPEPTNVDSSARPYRSTPTLDHHNVNHPNQEGNAFVLASLLHELTFWEATPKEFLRKSQSANDVGNSEYHANGHHRPDAPLRASSLSASRSVATTKQRHNNHHNSDHNQSRQRGDNDDATRSNGESFSQHTALQTSLETRSEQRNGSFRDGSSHDSAAAVQQPQRATAVQSPLEHAQTQRRPDESFNHPNDSHTQIVSSPTLAELQAACPWQKAVDPATGRTYYYDVETRQSQWDKVCVVYAYLRAFCACVHQFMV
jgi:WW domain